MAKTLDDYIKEITTTVGGRDLSQRWYRKTVEDLVPRITESNMISNLRRHDDRQARPAYGIMNLFYYRPLAEETLPYYDVFPLVIPIKKYTDGFLGINFHYLPVPLRLKLWEKFSPLTQEGRRMGWNRVSRWRFIKPCVKKYRAEAVKSRFVPIRDEAMNIAVYMPVHRFKKQRSPFRDNVVWRESRSNI